MDNEELELLVERIMRQYYMGDFESYNDESIREKYRQMIREMRGLKDNGSSENI